MNFLAATVCAVLLAGVASGSSLWSRELDPDTVERPIKEYREAYRRHLSRRQVKKECSAEEISKCKADACPGWTLVTKDEKEPLCEAVGGQETEAVFYLPDPDNKPCCKYHGCVVADCKKLQAQFEFDKTKKCTKDDKPDGPNDPCRTRTAAKTCGCAVETCQKKGCSANVTCSECHVLTAKTDECGCLTEKDSCELLKPDKETATCDATTKCPKCQTCKSTEKIFGDKCANKYKEQNKSPCVKNVCPPDEECSPCQISVRKSDGCCDYLTCQTVKEPAGCVKPDANGKCADDCLEPVDKPLVEGGACKETVKCCEPKKCVEKEPEVCEGCYDEAVEKDKCGCRHVVCKLNPELEMCKAKVSYTVKVKTGDTKSAALAKYQLTANEKQSIPLTPGKATVKITGACTPEQQNDPNAEKKECVVEIPAGKLNNGANRVVSVDKVCENIGIIEKVDVEMSDPNIWFVEEVVVEAPKDLSKPDEKSPVTLKVEKFLGKEDPAHKKWIELKGWKPTAKVETDLVKPMECSECNEYTRDQNLTCTPLHKGRCQPKACPEKDTCDECDVITEYTDDCGCSQNNCVPTIEQDGQCEEGKVPVPCVEANRDDPCHRELCCLPPICPKYPVPECDQCHRPSLTSVPTIWEKDNKTYPCPIHKCTLVDDCKTKEEVEKELNCNKCQEPVQSEEELECGCKKWVCGPKEPDCSKCNEDECMECKQVYSEECETVVATCVKKQCKEQPACTVPKTVDGKEEVDKCGCPEFVNKPCTNDHAHVCEPGKNFVAEGIDACGCSSKTLVPCDAVPACNKTCFELVGEKVNDGCCTKYTCQKKECPEKPKVQCSKCNRVVVHEDECKCCSTTCERIPCLPIKRCPKGTEPVKALDDCGCPTLLRCGPKEEKVKYCPVGKKCKKPVTTELCPSSECEDL